MPVTYRRLLPGDEAEIETFLRPRLAFSMFLLSNMRLSGLDFQPRPYHGEYFGAFDGEALCGVVAHFWNGVLQVQAPDHAAALVRTALQASRRPFNGLLGPLEQALAARQGLDVPAGRIQVDSGEYLYRMELAGLRVPELLVSGGARARRLSSATAQPDDLELVTRWRAEFLIEAMNEPDEPRTYQEARRNALRNIEDGRTWLLEVLGRPVAMTGFNAVLPEAVQVGGVYTPPGLRGRGYARAAVAASLLEARQSGAHTAILFTQSENISAQKAYTALGFERLGNFQLLLLEPE